MDKYTVYLWPGNGYLLTDFTALAESVEEAIDKVVVELIEKLWGNL